MHACISTRLGKRVNLPSWRFNICKTVLFFDASEIVVELSCTVSGMEKLLGGRVSRINGDFSSEYSSTIVRRKPISLCPDSYCIYLEKRFMQRYSFYLTTIFHHVPFYYFIYSGKITTFRRRRSIFFQENFRILSWNSVYRRNKHGNENMPRLWKKKEKKRGNFLSSRKIND